MTEAAEPVQLMRIMPRTREGCLRPKRASTLAPAPSPSSTTYLTCRKSSTVTRSSPTTSSEGYSNLHGYSRLNIISAHTRLNYLVNLKSRWRPLDVIRTSSLPQVDQSVLPGMYSCPTPSPARWKMDDRKVVDDRKSTEIEHISKSNPPNSISFWFRGWIDIDPIRRFSRGGPHDKA